LKFFLRNAISPSIICTFCEIADAEELSGKVAGAVEGPGDETGGLPDNGPEKVLSSRRRPGPSRKIRIATETSLNEIDVKRLFVKKGNPVLSDRGETLRGSFPSHSRDSSLNSLSLHYTKSAQVTRVPPGKTCPQKNS
jgi:hypothetical protein